MHNRKVNVLTTESYEAKVGMVMFYPNGLWTVLSINQDDTFVYSEPSAGSLRVKLTGYENFIGYMQLPENITNKIRITDDLPTVAKEISDEVLKVTDYVDILTDYYSDIMDDMIICNAGLKRDMYELSKVIPDALTLRHTTLGRDIVQLCELFTDDALGENTSIRALHKKVSDMYAKSVEVVGEDHDIPVGLQSLLGAIEDAFKCLEESVYSEFEKFDDNTTGTNPESNNLEKSEVLITKEQLAERVLPKFRMAVLHIEGEEYVFIPAKKDGESYYTAAYCYDLRSNSYSEAHCAFMDMFGMTTKEVADIIIMESLENAIDNNRIHLGAYGIVFKEQIAEASGLIEEMIEEGLLPDESPEVQGF